MDRPIPLPKVPADPAAVAQTVVYSVNLPTALASDAQQYPWMELAGFPLDEVRECERGLFLRASLSGGTITVSEGETKLALRLRWMRLAHDGDFGSVWRLFSNVLCPEGGVMWRSLLTGFVVPSERFKPSFLQRMDDGGAIPLGRCGFSHTTLLIDETSIAARPTVWPVVKVLSLEIMAASKTLSQAA